MSTQSILKQNEIFKSLSDEALNDLSSRLSPKKVPAGQVLFNLGDPGNEMMIVQSGKIAIYVPQPGRPAAGEALRVFQAGDVFGEMALIDSLPRSSSARAEQDSVILTLDGPTFQDLLRVHPDAAMGVMQGLSGRIRYTTDFIAEMRQWVGRMAEGNYQSIQIPAEYEDSSLVKLAAEFVQMAGRVREREEKLRQEVAQLRIEIDEKKRKQDVALITESEYYRDLKEKLKALREENVD